jgi:hypothetical protein
MDKQDFEFMLFEFLNKNDVFLFNYKNDVIDILNVKEIKDLITNMEV